MGQVYYWKLTLDNTSSVKGPYTKKNVEDHLNAGKAGYFFTLQPISTEEVAVTTTQIKVV